MLDNARIAAKKHKAQLRRNKIKRMKLKEDKLLNKGDMRPIVDRHRRRLKDNRDHHRSKREVEIET